MKNLLYTVIFFLVMTFFYTKSNAQGNANKTLSNLTSPTAANADLLPDNNNTRSLGNLSKSWRSLYLDSAIYIDSARFIAFKTGAGSGNTAIGKNVLHSDTSGYSNTAVGYECLYYNKSGYENIAIGRGALYKNTTGYDNTALGYHSLYSNKTGEENTASGYQSLYSNTNGSQNTANGSYSLYTNTTGFGNAANGYSTLTFNTTGNYNTANGWKALYSNTKGSYNTANGYQALLFNRNGSGNTAEGAGALFYNYSGSYNVAIGNEALDNNSSGSSNIAIGNQALHENVSGSYNVAIGEEALGGGGSSNFNSNQSVAIGYNALFNLGKYCTAVGTEAGVYNTGANNTYVGFHAGNSVNSGSSNTIIGYGADISDGSYSNATAIGNYAVSGASNRVRIGNGSVTSIGGAVGWTNFSDERIKNNINQDVPGLAFINLLKPVTYNFDLSKEEQIFKRKDSADWKEKYDIQKVKFTGFLAQEVEAAAKEINYDFSGVDAPINDKDVYGLRYGDFVVPLVKAVQELSRMNDVKDSAINDLQNQINELKAMIVSNQPSINNQQSTIISSASLQQNIPNPFSNSTTISYSLPQHYSSAKIIITDKNGNTLKVITLSNNKGSVNVDASTLSSGAYQYSLYVDGRLIASKQMLLTK